MYQKGVYPIYLPLPTIYLSNYLFIYPYRPSIYLSIYLPLPTHPYLPTFGAMKRFPLHFLGRGHCITFIEFPPYSLGLLPLFLLFLYGFCPHVLLFFQRDYCLFMKKGVVYKVKEEGS